MFQFIKANKMITATAVIMVIMIVALVTGLVAQHLAISAGIMIIGAICSAIAYYKQSISQ